MEEIKKIAQVSQACLLTKEKPQDYESFRYHKKTKKRDINPTYKDYLYNSETGKYLTSEYNSRGQIVRDASFGYFAMV